MLHLFCRKWFIKVLLGNSIFLHVKIMKKLFRLENLLILFALAIGVYTVLALPPFVGSDGFPYGYVVKTSIAASMEWMWMIVPAYLIHYILRTIGRRNNTICVLHVILTIGTGIVTADFATSVIPGWHTTVYPPLYDGYSSIDFPFVASVGFWLLQAAFIVYGIVVIHRWRKTATS